MVKSLVRLMSIRLPEATSHKLHVKVQIGRSHMTATQIKRFGVLTRF